LGVFRNWVLRIIFGYNTEEWRKLHNKEHHNLHYSPDIIRMNESRAGHVAYMTEMRNV
jgi:hypothetical protein